MRTFQLVFRGGRVQNLMADRYHHREDAVQFRMGQNTVEFPSVDLLMIDELADDGFAQPTRMKQPIALAAAMG